MFDVGFWEIALIMLVALIVIGPHRLPDVARTAGLWVGRTRRFMQTVKADIEKEVAAEELKKALDYQAKLPELEELIDEPPSATSEAATENAANRLDKPTQDGKS